MDNKRYEYRGRPPKFQIEDFQKTFQGRRSYNLAFLLDPRLQIPTKIIEDIQYYSRDYCDTGIFCCDCPRFNADSCIPREVRKVRLVTNASEPEKVEQVDYLAVSLGSGKFEGDRYFPAPKGIKLEEIPKGALYYWGRLWNYKRSEICESCTTKHIGQSFGLDRQNEDEYRDSCRFHCNEGYVPEKKSHAPVQRVNRVYCPKCGELAHMALKVRGEWKGIRLGREGIIEHRETDIYYCPRCNLFEFKRKPFFSSEWRHVKADFIHQVEYEACLLSNAAHKHCSHVLTPESNHCPICEGYPLLPEKDHVSIGWTVLCPIMGERIKCRHGRLKKGYYANDLSIHISPCSICAGGSNNIFKRYDEEEKTQESEDTDKAVDAVDAYDQGLIPNPEAQGYDWVEDEEEENLFTERDIESLEECYEKEPGDSDKTQDIHGQELVDQEKLSHAIENEIQFEQAYTRKPVYAWEMTAKRCLASCISVWGLPCVTHQCEQPVYGDDDYCYYHARLAQTTQNKKIPWVRKLLENKTADWAQEELKGNDFPRLTTPYHRAYELNEYREIVQETRQTTEVEDLPWFKEAAKNGSLPLVLQAFKRRCFHDFEDLCDSVTVEEGADFLEQVIFPDPNLFYAFILLYPVSPKFTNPESEFMDSLRETLYEIVDKINELSEEDWEPFISIFEGDLHRAWITANRILTGDNRHFEEVYQDALPRQYEFQVNRSTIEYYEVHSREPFLSDAVIKQFRAGLKSNNEIHCFGMDPTDKKLMKNVLRFLMWKHFSLPSQSFPDRSQTETLIFFHRKRLPSNITSEKLHHLCKGGRGGMPLAWGPLFSNLLRKKAERIRFMLRIPDRYKELGWQGSQYELSYWLVKEDPDEADNIVCQCFLQSIEKLAECRDIRSIVSFIETTLWNRILDEVDSRRSKMEREILTSPYLDSQLLYLGNEIESVNGRNELLELDESLLPTFEASPPSYNAGQELRQFIANLLCSSRQWRWKWKDDYGKEKKFVRHTADRFNTTPRRVRQLLQEETERFSAALIHGVYKTPADLVRKQRNLAYGIFKRENQVKIPFPFEQMYRFIQMDFKPNRLLKNIGNKEDWRGCFLDLADELRFKLELDRNGKEIMFRLFDYYLRESDPDYENKARLYIQWAVDSLIRQGLLSPESGFLGDSDTVHLTREVPSDADFRIRTDRGRRKDSPKRLSS